MAAAARASSDPLSSRLGDAARAWRALALICLVTALGFAHRFMIGIFVDPISHDVGLTDVQFGILQGIAYAVAYALASIPVGRIVDWASRVKILSAGAFIWIVGSILLALAQSFYALVAARVILGIGETTIMPASISLIWDLFEPRRRGIAMGLFSASTALGVSLSAAVPGPLFDRIVEAGIHPLGLTPWRLTYLTIAAASILLVLPLTRLREPVRRETGVKDAGTGSDASGGIATLSGRWNLLLSLMIGGICITLAEATLLSWVPSILIRHFALARSAFAGWYGLAVFASSVAGAILGGIATDRAGRSGRVRHRMVPALVATLIVCPLSLFLISSSLSTFGAFFALSSTLLSAGAISVMTAIAAVLPNELRGRGIGIYNFLNILFSFGIGQTAIPILARALGSDHSLGSATAVLIGVVTIIGAAALMTGIARSAGGSD